MKTLLSIITILLLVNCSKSPINQEPPIPTPGRVFICNEGNFTYGNASLSVYNPETRESANQIFYNANNLPLGDVFQSMTIIGDKGFMVINNSGKIVVISMTDYKLIGTITGLVSPRFILPINSHKCYVSDLSQHSISIIDPISYSITGNINLGHTSEQFVLQGKYAYVCSWSRESTVHKIDTDTDTPVASLTITKQPNSMVLDANGKLWVLSDGSYPGSTYKAEKGALTRINPETMQIEATFVFANEALSPSQLHISPDKKTLYFINGNWNNAQTKGNNIMRMGILDNKLPDTPFISAPETLFYAIGVDPQTGEIYLSDAVDYVRRGNVMRYTPEGSLIHTFKADIIPANFCFK